MHFWSFSDNITGSTQMSGMTGAPNGREKVKAIQVYARKANAADIYFGDSNVSSSRGREIPPGSTLSLSFGGGSVPFSTFYVIHATSGDDVDVVLITE